MKPENARPQGELRQSQIVTTFGPGSLIDLPTRSAIVGGLDEWMNARDEIHEDRLVDKLRRLLNVDQIRLFAPPPENDDPSAPRAGIVAWEFPGWFLTEEVRRSDGGFRTRRLVHVRLLSKRKFVDDDRKKLSVVPIRFVQACRRGHISDVDWRTFVHQKNPECPRPLWMDERGTSGDLAEVVVRCECGEERRLSQANVGVLGHCRGHRPWLGQHAREDCDEPNRLLVRHASNAYFPQVMSVISLPDRDEKLKAAVDAAWDHLQYADDLDDVVRERKKKPPVKQAVEGFTDEHVLEEILIRKGVAPPRPEISVKGAEFDLLSNENKESIGEDAPNSEFFARSFTLPAPSGSNLEKIERVVLVHKLREVVAQVGFTRFEALSPDIEGELSLDVRAAPLSREADWLPAIQNRGEGLFVQFRKDAINEWRSRPAVVQREQLLRNGFEAWRHDHPHSQRTFPGLGYILMHSLSHALLTAISLECGYPASSIRERVYAGDAGYGILLYTGTPDAEGTLGGLIEAGKRLQRHVESALQLAQLCSNDPVCSQHDPSNTHEVRFLHGAACHGCMLVAETSCEQHNDFLDRALLVPTVDSGDAAFFKAEGLA